MRIGVVGGTGPLGKGIALRLADAGHDVVMGSRDEARAAGIVAELQEQWGARVATLAPGTNEAAASEPVVFLATVWDAAVPTAHDLAARLDGAIVVSVANGLEKVGRQFRPVLPSEGSVTAAVAAAAPGAKVVAALQHVPAASLTDLDADASCDVLVAGDDDDARATVIELVDQVPGLRGLDAGGLHNAVGIESFAAAMLTVNLRHKGETTLHLGGVGDRR
ncbi:MAG TPA: NADPH-dependent F420 reductase [Acidimicrobiia bacterium]|nr:NADPH-dependent F420 reductase [Acidimicrobiia bacterium]